MQLARVVQSPHDSLTKLLNTTSIDWAYLLLRVMFRIFGTIEGGHLIIDETTIDKSFARVIEGCSWIWSSRDTRYVFGYHVTLLLWTNGTLTIPLAFTVYQKAKEKTHQITSIDIAVTLLGYAKNVLKMKPEYVLMDGFYSADKVLKCLHEWEWKYVMRVKKNRVLDGKQIQVLRRNPYWEASGMLACKLQARIIREGKRYLITNDFTAPKKRIHDLYGIRWKIEEVFRVLHSELGIDECESRSKRSQMAHFSLVLIGFGLLESERTRTERSTHYSLMLEYRLKPSFVHLASLATAFEGA